MKLYEYLAKEIFSKNGLPVPKGYLCLSPEDAARAALELGPVAVKAQILAGGRGKAGGITFAATPEEAGIATARLLGSEIRGYPVTRVLVEEKLNIQGELYLGFTVDTSDRRPVALASCQGGVNIEEVPPEKLVRLLIDPLFGFSSYSALYLGLRLGLKGELLKEFVSLALILYWIFMKYDAELVEINPLAIVEGHLIAADARLNIDDDALYRHPEIEVIEDGSELEKAIKNLGLAYVQLDGNIAVLANGAGITMATLDTLEKFGGRAANFLDAGGGAGAEPMAKALDLILDTGPRAVLINIFGGITRCDEVARALIQVKEKRGQTVPIILRLVGTNEDEAYRLLKTYGIEAFKGMPEAVAAVVSATQKL
ncbi:ADP-forming succinate--CoA ligase subunit beta [Moorella sulfitireducens (nom. illeg.)]|uniref:ADP-forming succinate--CoA ligase subunit beta n=1 Tax=Neomoorella sulfitireducens TaxID=2972948 RepID=UPI0021AC8DEB|nr:ADP-forming succinate--CoA ligase subunit beta [Moorella sulfitireducens]